MIKYKLLHEYKIKPLKEEFIIKLGDKSKSKLKLPKNTWYIGIAEFKDNLSVYLRTNKEYDGERGIGVVDFKIKDKTELEKKIDKFVELIAEKR